MSKCLVHSLTAVVESLAEHIARDVAAFATHAKRSTVQITDVLLVARRNPELRLVLEAYAEKNKLMAPRQQRKRAVDADSEQGQGLTKKKRKAIGEDDGKSKGKRKDKDKEGEEED